MSPSFRWHCPVVRNSLCHCQSDERRCLRTCLCLCLSPELPGSGYYADSTSRFSLGPCLAHSSLALCLPRKFRLCLSLSLCPARPSLGCYEDSPNFVYLGLCYAARGSLRLVH